MKHEKSDNSSNEFESINKYIRDDSKEDNNKSNNFSKKFEINNNGPTEVFGRVGEGESYSNNETSHKAKEDVDESFSKIKEKTVSKSPVTDAKQDFIKQMEDDSLTMDTCSKVNKDWNKK
ncbi:hypothetical protein GOV12_05110 [Candidatus Pacearchaeota archaeon]|nr:hypothetical protein [Candidatus Pacearchaeota archaeon]